MRLCAVAAGTLMALCTGGAAGAPQPGLIVFSSNRDGDFDIYVMNADGSGQRRLTANSIVEGDPQWLPGGRVVFTRCRVSINRCELVTASPTGGPAEKLAVLPPCAFDVDVSPDGKRIALAQWQPCSEQEPPRSARVVVTGLDGRNRVLPLVGPSDSIGPDWSPDGRRLVFAAGRSGGRTANLYVWEDFRGRVLRRLTSHPGSDGQPSWSSDGRRVVFVRFIGREDAVELYSIGARGGRATRLTDNDVWEESPDA